MLRQPSPWVTRVVCVIIIFGIVLFMWGRRSHATPKLPEIKVQDCPMCGRARPTPSPTPMVTAVKQIFVQPPAPKAQPSPKTCQPCEERLARYRKAVETGMGTDDRFNVLETPKLNGQNPSVFARGNDASAPVFLDQGDNQHQP